MLSGFSSLRLSSALASTSACKHFRTSAFALACYRRCSPQLKHVVPPLLSPKAFSQVRNFSGVGRLVTSYSSTHQSAIEDNSLLPPGLYLVGTPIGNLEDLSVRALKVLQTATIVLAEDTRHSRKLLNHYNIDAHLHSFHQHNENSKQDKVS